MTLKLNGTNSEAAPAYAGDDADTGLQCGTNELKLVTGGTARATVDSSGNFGIGTTTPTSNASTNLHVSSSGPGTNAQVRVTGNNATGLDIIQGGDSTGYVWLRDNNDLLFGTNNTTRMRILAGGGLTFGGDTAATNALDDYEEGTWTPTFHSGITNPTYTNTFGGYTKIGRLVTFTLRMDAGGTTNSSQARIAGLPFTSNNANIQGGATFNYAGNIVGNADGLPTLHVSANSSILSFFFNSGANFNGNSGNGVLGTLHIHGFYYTA